MNKTLLVLFLGLFAFQWADAQKKPSEKDSIIYYMKNSGQLALTKSDADYTTVIMPRDTSGLYPVAQFNPKGKRIMAGHTIKQLAVLVLQGQCVTFFPNGRQKSIMTFEKGHPKGARILFYPNGKLYALERFAPDSYKILYVECRDSTGNIVAENGNGRWLRYTDNFDSSLREGVVNEFELNLFVVRHVAIDTTGYSAYDKTGNIVEHPTVEPRFNGDLDSLRIFLKNNMHYPLEDLEAEITGKVTISFIVEKNGALTKLKVEKAPSESLGEAGLKTLLQSPPWVPASDQGIPVRAKTTMILNFNITKH